jgi:hypothetical protein
MAREASSGSLGHPEDRPFERFGFCSVARPTPAVAPRRRSAPILILTTPCASVGQVMAREAPSGSLGHPEDQPF